MWRAAGRENRIDSGRRAKGRKRLRKVLISRREAMGWGSFHKIIDRQFTS